VRWVELDPQKLRDKVQTSEPDLRAYFNAHKDDFKITTEQRRARYVFVDSSQAGASLQVSDEELKRDFNPEAFIKRVRVSQIVLNVPKEDTANKDKTPTTKPVISEEDVRTKAQGISQRAQGSEGNPAEDFAKLAREFSEDAGTKSKGGDLGWLNKGDKREPSDPLTRVFTMKKDETSQPIKKGDSYYVLKVTDRETPTFAAAREDLLKAARLRKGYSRGVEIATEAEQQLKETKNPDTVVAAINKKYGAQLSSVKETAFFSEGDQLADLGAAAEFQSSVFELQNIGDTGQQIPVDKGFAIAQYTEKRDPHDPAFEEVNSKVETAYRADKAKELARDRARELAKAQNLDELKKMTASMGLKLDERLGLTASDSIGSLVTETSRAFVYKLKVGEVTKEPIKGENDVYVVAAIENRKEADMGAPFQKERKSIEQRMLDDKRTSFFSTYLLMTQKQLKDEGKIKIYDDAVAAAVQSSGSPSQAGQPRTPPRSSGPPRRAGRGSLGAPLSVPGKR
jgi:peptidyl-prolyl cis-trans isomerase D